MPQILVFGDSIAYGAWDKEGGWVERLKIFSNRKSIESKLEFYCAIYNLAIDGDLTGGYWKGLKLKRKKDYGKKKPFLFLLLG